MKKVLSMLVALVMLLSFGAAMAETEEVVYATYSGTFEPMLMAELEPFADPMANADDPEYPSFVMGVMFFEYIAEQLDRDYEMEARPLYQDALLTLSDAEIVGFYVLEDGLTLTLAYDMATKTITSSESATDLATVKADLEAEGVKVYTAGGMEWSMVLLQLVQIAAGIE